MCVSNLIIGVVLHPYNSVVRPVKARGVACEQQLNMRYAFCRLSD